MTWLEEERKQRAVLSVAFDGLRTEVTALRQEMQLGFAGIDARFERQNAMLATALEKQNIGIEKQNIAIEKQNTTIEKQNTTIEKQSTSVERALKEQTQFFFVAWAVLLAAIVGIYARAA